MTTERDGLIELRAAWRTHNDINLFLIDRIGASGMKCTLSSRGGRDVARQLAHMHDVRVYQLEARAKDLAAGLGKFQSKDGPKVVPTKAELKKAFRASGKAVETFLEEVFEAKPKRRGFKRGIFTTLGYFISHESHHRGSILLTLKQCGEKLDSKTAGALWGAWDKA